MGRGMDPQCLDHAQGGDVAIGPQVALHYGLDRRRIREEQGQWDGPGGLEAIRDWDPSLILLDVMMPKASGIEILPEIRRITDAPVVMLSARGEVDDKVEGLAHGADDYLSKPFEFSELLARI